MTSAARRSRLFAVVAAAAALALILVAVPALGRGGPGGPAGNAAPAASAKAKPSKEPKAEKVPVTLTGTVGTRTDADGGTEYTLTAGGTVYVLEAGPPWWWGDANPLAAFVGKSVTIEGGQAVGSSTIEVRAADGTAIRGEGKPPWAGGWKVVGERHPGWAQWKVDKLSGNDAANGAAGHGRPPWAGPKSPEPSPGG